MKLLVLDGNSIVNRAFYGVKLLTTQSGLYTNAIYGFLTMLNKILEEESPDGVAVAFDLKAPTFRHKAYAGYKATRKGMPPELAQQMPTLKELLLDLGYTLVECEGFEADDILGTLAQKCRESGNDCVIATGDRDSLQLVGGPVTVRLATTKFGQPQVTVYDEEKIREEYGVTPRQLIDIKALMGDSSDNIPGVSGIGQKGAGDLIQKYGSVQYIYDHLDELELKPAMRRKLTEGRDSAFLSYELGKISTQAPVDTELSHYLVRPVDRQKAAALMTKLELFKLMEKMGLSPEETAPEGKDSTERPLLVEKETDPFALLATLREQGEGYFVTRYTKDGAVEQMAFALPDRIAVIAPEEAFLQSLFTEDTIALHTHDTKPLYKALDKLSILPKICHMDTLLAGYLLNPSASDYTMERLCALYGIAGGSGTGESLSQAASVIRPLSEALEQEIAKNDQGELLRTIELPLALVLARMENIGFAVDGDGIADYGRQLQGEIDRLQQEIYREAGREFNLNSPKQLGQVLFEELHLPAGKKTKSGYSTSAEVLERLRYDHPIVEHILQYRTVAKLKSTYCDGLLKEIAPDGRIHSSFNQAETRTGRISSTEPNLQNIPVRTALGRELRRFFIAEEGKALVDADYSQIELRVLAHVANDPAMTEAFRNDEDIHTSTAAQVFRLPEQMVTPLMRSRAKAVNFGIVYGIGPFSLAKDIGVTRKEADEYIKAYLDHYSGVRQYMEDVVEAAKEKGYVETIFGRRRYLPELTSSNFNLRSFGQRVARNMPIQGTAADIIKIAMIRVENRLRAEQLNARLILQVHDELIVESPVEEQEQVKALLQEEMAAAVSLSVPMVAEANIGKTWFDAKG
ncbi:MAG: DNA polymerase I [Oscillospiraceae bacterium]|nr:DNA polymerase I [Oscillospiraceae bacterium]